MNDYSISRIAKEYKIPETPIKNIIRYFEFKPVRQSMHAGKPSFFYSEENVNQLKDFYFNHSRKERFELFKKKFGNNFGPQGPSESQKEKIREQRHSTWGLNTVRRNTGVTKQGLSTIISHLFNISLKEFLEIPHWDKLETIRNFYESLGEDNYSRGRKLCDLNNKKTNYRQRQGKSLKSFREEIERNLDTKVWANREEARNFLGKNDTTTYALYKLYGFEFFTKSHISFYKWKDLKKLKNILNSKKVNLGHLHNAFNERLYKTGIDYDREKCFPDFNNRRFDFYIPSLNMAIEVQGTQHFNGYDFQKRKMPKEQQRKVLLERLEADNAKIRYCKDHGIDLVWITVPSDVDDFFNFYIKKNFKKGLTEWYHRGHLPIEVWEKDRDRWNKNWKCKTC